MATDVIRDKLATLRDMKAKGLPPGQQPPPKLLAQLIADRSNLVAAAAAELAGELKAENLAPDLARAFENFLKDGARKDPQCKGKIAILSTLRQFDACQPDLMLRGVRYVQMEPAFGGPQDTAAPLRVECAAALLESGDQNAVLEIAQLLADPQTDARIGAARILGQSLLPVAEALLRLRVLVGEKDPASLQEYLGALLKLNPQSAIEFVARALRESRGEQFDSIAVALGESRLEAALPVLIDALGQQRLPARRQAILTAIALLRRNEAMDFLLSVMQTYPEAVSVESVAAMAIYDKDEALTQKVRQAAHHRGSPKLQQAVDKCFGRR